MNINTAFCRSLLKLVLAEVRKHATSDEIKAAWVYHFERDNWEFHGPGREPIEINMPHLLVHSPKFYWYGSADNAYDARAKGWQAWLEQFHPETNT